MNNNENQRKSTELNEKSMKSMILDGKSVTSSCQLKFLHEPIQNKAEQIYIRNTEKAIQIDQTALLWTDSER